MKTLTSPLKIALLCALTAASASVMAQYKCQVAGKTVFMDEPCREGRRYADDMPRPAMRESFAAALPGGPIEAGKLLCRELAPKMVTWKDDESLRVGKVYGGKMTVVDKGGVKVAGRQFFVPINGKNSYGGYAGYKPLICNTSEDGSRILNVDDILLNAKP